MEHTLLAPLSRWIGIVISIFFSTFVLWEGGGSISRDFSAAKGKQYHTWVGWGGKSESKGFTIAIAEAMDASRVNVTKEEVPSAKHGINNDVQNAILRWITEVVEPALEEK